jgi:hypothetical protein
VKLWFGPFVGRELEDAPDSTLRWIESTLQTEPAATAPVDERDQLRLRNIQAKQESRRILGERRRNGVRVPDPPRTVKCSSCRADIVWLQTSSKRNMPVDASSFTPGDIEFDSKKHVSHFATCPNADKHRSSRK